MPLDRPIHCPVLVEPTAGERVEENSNPVGRVFSGARRATATPFDRVFEARR